MHETGRKGDIGVSAVTADLLSQGLEVLFPVSSCCPFDLAVLRGCELVKVQVKYAAKKNGCVEAKLGRAVIGGCGKINRRSYLPVEVDVIAVYCPDTKDCYYVKSSLVGTWVRFRLDAPKNGYVTGIKMANEYRVFPT
jgi:hypothetical protein